MDHEVEFISEVEGDNQWLQNHYEKIQEEYPNKFVAVSGRKIIATGEKIEVVVKSLKEMGREPAMILIEFIPKKGLILIV